MNKRLIAILALVALLAGTSAFYSLDALTPNSNAEAEPQATLAATDQEAPPGSEMVLLDLEGVPRRLDDWRGQVLVLNFWATWCPPCRREIPTFIELQDELGGRGVQFVGVAVDSLQQVAPYAERNGINYPTLQGEANGLELSISLGNHRSILPYTVLFNRSGEIVKHHTGEMTREQLLSEINPLL